MNKDCQLIAEAYDQVNNQQPTQSWFRVDTIWGGSFDDLTIEQLTDVDEYLRKEVEIAKQEYIDDIPEEDFEEYTDEELQEIADEVYADEVDGVKMLFMGDEDTAYMYGPIDPEMANDKEFLADIDRAIIRGDAEGLKGLISISTNINVDDIEVGVIVNGAQD